MSCFVFSTFLFFFFFFIFFFTPLEVVEAHHVAEAIALVAVLSDAELLVEAEEVHQPGSTAVALPVLREGVHDVSGDNVFEGRGGEVSPHGRVVEVDDDDGDGEFFCLDRLDELLGKGGFVVLSHEELDAFFAV